MADGLYRLDTVIHIFGLLGAANLVGATARARELVPGP
jgi:hypothetical protein